MKGKMVCIFVVVIFLCAVMFSYIYLQSKSTSGIAQGYYGTAMEYRQKKDYARTVAYLNRSIALNPKDWTVHYALGQTYVLLKEYSIALDEFNVTRDLLTESGNADRDIQRVNNSIKAITAVTKEQ